MVCFYLADFVFSIKERIVKRNFVEKYMNVIINAAPIIKEAIITEMPTFNSPYYESNFFS